MITRVDTTNLVARLVPVPSPEVRRRIRQQADFKLRMQFQDGPEVGDRCGEVVYRGGLYGWVSDRAWAGQPG